MLARRILVAPVVLALLAAGCGGDDSADPDGATTKAATPADAEAAIEEVWAAFVEGVETGDGEAACAGLSEDLARPNEANFQLGAGVPGGPSCAETFADKQAMASFASGLSPDFAELNVEGTTADGISGAAKPTFAETDGEWEITSFYGVLPEA